MKKIVAFAALAFAWWWASTEPIDPEVLYGSEHP